MHGEQLTLHGELFGQRFRSQPVSAAVEPDFAGEAFIELPEDLSSSPSPAPSSSVAQQRQPTAAPVGSGMHEALRLLGIRQPMRLCVTQNIIAGGFATGV